MTVIFAVSASAKNVGVTVTSQRYVPDQTIEKSIRKVRIIWRYVPYQLKMIIWKPITLGNKTNRWMGVSKQ